MQKTYQRINWENYPSDQTPINETNLNKIDVAVDEIDDRVIIHETTKATKVEVATLVQDVTFEESTGIFTIRKKNGAVLKIDTKLEKIAVNFSYDKTTQQIVLTLIDGTQQYIDLSALITQFEFLDSETIGFEITSAGEVKATVLNGSVTEDKLQPDYLADIKIEVAKAQTSVAEAKKSETNASNSADTAGSKASEALASAVNAADSAKKAESYAVGGTGSRTGEDTDNAKYYSEKSKTSAETAKESAERAAENAVQSGESAATSANSANSAKTYAGTANSYAAVAGSKANEAKESANTAKLKSDAASASAVKAESYAHGGTGVRANEDVDNAKYYKEQAERISQGLSGALLPMGTITFSQLAEQTKQSGYMYNISDSFVTDGTFKEGAGYTYPEGTNVYYTADGFWDCISGTSVVGVKGSAESTYRKGNVNITPADIGLGNVNNTTDIDKPISKAVLAALDLKLDKDGDSENNTVSYESADMVNPTGWADITTLESGEKHTSIFRKLSLAVKNLRYLYKCLGTTDISAIGDGTVKGAIASQNETFAKKIEEINNSLGNNSPFEEFQSGQACSVSTASGTWVNIEITFDKEFTKVPNVIGIATATNNIQTKMYSFVRTVSTSGFTARVMGEGYSTNRKHQFNWMAFV